MRTPPVLAALAFAACSSSNAGSSPAVLRLCEAVGALACDETQAECMTSEGARYDRAVKMGCGAESAAVLDCEVSRPLVCKKTSEGPLTVPTADCRVLADDLRSCLPSCGSSATGVASAHFYCNGGKVGDVSADCASGCACECVKGPKAGTKFNATSCGLTDVERLLAGNCY